jgi:hypothetical protein
MQAKVQDSSMNYIYRRIWGWGHSNVWPVNGALDVGRTQTWNLSIKGDKEQQRKEESERMKNGST